MDLLQIGIRLHDVNASLSEEDQTIEARAKKAQEEGFSCVHLALQKVIQGVTFDDSSLTEGLAHQLRRLFDRYGLNIAVLGCYLNLATPDAEKLREFQRRYIAHMRVASLCSAGLVGTETGAPNIAYKLDANTHSDAALKTFLYNLEPVIVFPDGSRYNMINESYFNEDNFKSLVDLCDKLSESYEKLIENYED